MILPCLRVGRRFWGMVNKEKGIDVGGKESKN